MKRFAVIGHPLGHSLSPLLHNWGYAQCGVDAEYLARPVTPEELPGFVDEVRAGAFQGLSVTIPHKQAIIPLLDGRTWRAKLAGAVNTVFWEDGALQGDNTDVAGIVEPVRARGLNSEGQPIRALILGAGGAARAACAAMRELGAATTVTNRTRAKAEAVAHDFAAAVADWDDRAHAAADLVINTTPLGMSGELEAASPWPEDAPLPEGATIFDLVYNPLETALLTRARTQGLATIPGLEMFVHQGLEQFRIFTGETLEPNAATAVVRGALEATA